jgi:hypothetical protein
VSINLGGVYKLNAVYSGALRVEWEYIWELMGPLGVEGGGG